MAEIYWCWGWEARADNAALSTWATTGTVAPNTTSKFHQHPDGYGGGEVSLKCDANGTMQTLDSIKLSASNAQIQSSFYADGSYVAGRTLFSVPDSNGDPVIAVNSADAGDKSRLAVLHNGVTMFTSAKYFTKESWHMVMVRAQTGGSNVNATLFSDKVNIGYGQTAKTTLSEFWGMTWGGVSTGSTYHDHHVVWSGLGSEPRSSTWIQALRPQSTRMAGGFTASSGSIHDALEYSDDGLTVSTTTDPDMLEVRMDDRSDVSLSWTPKVIGVSTVAIADGDAALSKLNVELKLGVTSVAGTTLTSLVSRDIALMQSVMPGGGAWTSSALDQVNAIFKVSS